MLNCSCINDFVQNDIESPASYKWYHSPYGNQWSGWSAFLTSLSERNSLSRMVNEVVRNWHTALVDGWSWKFHCESSYKILAWCRLFSFYCSASLISSRCHSALVKVRVLLPDGVGSGNFGSLAAIEMKPDWFGLVWFGSRREGTDGTFFWDSMNTILDSLSNFTNGWACGLIVLARSHMENWVLILLYNLDDKRFG